MRPLAIQFVCRKQAVRRFGVVSLGIGLTALILSAQHYNVTRSAAHEAAAVLRKLTDDPKHSPHAPRIGGEQVVPESTARAVNAAIARLNLPWRELFGALESSKPHTVALLSLEPDGRKRTLLIHAEARAPEHMIAFVERLRTHETFEHAVLVRHELRESEPHRPYRFALEVRWREDM